MKGGGHFDTVWAQRTFTCVAISPLKRRQFSKHDVVHLGGGGAPGGGVLSVAGGVHRSSPS